MHYGDEPLHPILATLSVVFGALTGFAFGIAGFFLATVFPAMLRTALPGMSDAVFLGLWSITVALFTNEYHVPLLPPAVAALMGTATELSMPVLLMLGLATRFGAFVLFFFNIIAVVSYAAHASHIATETWNRLRA